MGLNKSGIAFLVAAGLATGTLFRLDQISKKPQARGLVDKALMSFLPSASPKSMDDESTVTKVVFNSLFNGGSRSDSNLTYYLKDYLTSEESVSLINKGLSVEKAFELSAIIIQNPKGNGNLSDDERRGFLLYILAVGTGRGNLGFGPDPLPHPNMGLNMLASRIYEDVRSHYISVMANNLLDPRP